MSTKGKSGKGGKGRRRGKDKKVIDPNKLTHVDRTFCELTITDLNKKLAHLRSHLASLDETNVNLTEKMREIEEDRMDVAAHLERTLLERNDKIQELEERLMEVTKVRDAENHTAEDTIKNLEAKYKAMHDQLTSEIKLLNSKLNSLDEFRIQRDIMMAKFEDQETVLKDTEREHKETLWSLERKQIIEKHALKKEVEVKLLQVSEDFTRSSEIRNAGYTRRLIRENIALHKEIDSVVVSKIRIEQDMREQRQNHKQMIEQYAALGEVRDQLVINMQQKMNIIEKLTQQYESMKSKFIEAIRYRTLYEKLISRDVCERFTLKEMKRKVRNLLEKIEILKREKKKMSALHNSHENEIMRLRKTIQSIRTTLEAAITGTEQPQQHKLSIRSTTIENTVGLAKEPNFETELQRDEWYIEREAGRKTLLSALMSIVAQHTDKFLETPSVSTISTAASPVYRMGRLGFMPKSETSLMDIFRGKKQPDDSSELPKYVLKHQNSKILPKQRYVENDIIDVELGSTLYVSSSNEPLDIVQVEEEPLEMEEASSSDIPTSVISFGQKSTTQI